MEEFTLVFGFGRKGPQQVLSPIRRDNVSEIPDPWDDRSKYEGVDVILLSDSNSSSSKLSVGFIWR